MIKTKSALLIGAMFAVAGSAWAGAPEKCGGADIATGPFGYTNFVGTQATFTGLGGEPVASGFDVSAPAPNKKTDAPDVFAGQSNTPSECADYADAAVGVIEIEQVADAAGNPLDVPVKVALDSALGMALQGAFSVQPAAWSWFAPGDSTHVSVAVSNPDVTTYGEYAVKLAAKADGYGIGVGAGAVFSLVLRAPTLTDKTPPVVTVSKPTSDEVLGKLHVVIRAYDPFNNSAATGLAAMSASIKSAGGAVPSQAIALTLDQTLPVAPAVSVMGVGNFMPAGGSGDAGSSDDAAFTASARSGIGTYVVTANAADGAGNTASNSKTVKVGYAVSFTKAFSTSNCQTGGNAACSGQFKFDVNRSSITSDGAFMYDHTVAVKLRDVGSGQIVATHIYGSLPGGINANVQIDTAAPAYQTNFKRGDIGASGPKAYQADVYFTDVDGVQVLQGTSEAVTF